MFGKSIKLFSLFGFDVRVDLTWIFLLALVVWTLGSAVFPTWVDEQPARTYYLMGFGGAVILFLSIVWHELSHSLVAAQFGLPMEGITLFIFGGMAEMHEEPPSARAEFVMAVAGPASSILLAAVLFGLQAGLKAGGVAETVTAVFLWGGIINAALAVFNLVPGFPLDGGRALRAAVWYWKGSLRYATRMAAEGGKAFGLVLIILGFLNLVTMNPVGGLWWILIGLFVRSAAQQSYQQMLVRQLLSGEPVARFMTENPVTVPPSASLQKVVEDYVYRYHHKLYPVAENGTIRGCLTLAQLKDVPREKWEQTTVGEIASPCGEANTIGSDADALDALSRMREQGSGRLLVERQGEVVGTLTLKDLLEFLSLKLELDPETPSDLQGLPAGTSEIEPEGTETQTQKEKSA